MNACLALAAVVAVVVGCLSEALAAPPPPQDLLTPADKAGGTPLPDLVLSMEGPSSVPTSTPMTYTLTVGNAGTADATGVAVVATLPSSLTTVTASGTN